MTASRSIPTAIVYALAMMASTTAARADPTSVVDGIEGPKNDGIFLIRSPAYAVSRSRRAK